MQQLRLAWQWAFVFTGSVPMTRRLTWEPTELGRRTPDERYHIVSKHDRCELLNAAWDTIGTAPSMAAAEQLAERLEARARWRGPDDQSR